MKLCQSTGIICLAALLSFIAPPATAQSLTGQWIVRWGSDAKNENTLALNLNKERITGTYMNDANASCTVTGNANQPSRKFALTIVCPDWDIRMQGSLASDEKTASGNYQAYVDATGKFAMRKK